MHRVFTKRSRRFSLLVLPVALVSKSLFGAADLEVHAEVDRTMVARNQRFTLSVTLTGKEAQSAPSPQLPDLSSFASYLGSSTSQSIEFVNGKMSVTKTIGYHFLAHTPGTHTIGPVIVTYRGGSLQTPPITITVEPGGSSPAPAPPPAPSRERGREAPDRDVFIRAEADKMSVYPNEPVVVTYRIYTRINLNPVGISKQPSTTGFWVEEFEMPQRLPTTTEIFGGQRYTVAVFKRLALFPTSPGRKTIESLGLDCDVQVQRPRSRDPFDIFFDDSFLMGRTERKTFYSNPVTIEVKPFPEEQRPADFSGLAGRFRLEATVDKTAVATHEALTFRLTLSGSGNVRLFKTPEMFFPTDFEVYPPKVVETVDRSGQAITGAKTFEYVLVPRNPGRHKIPSVRFSYFDPEKRAYETLRTPEILIDVKKGKEGFVSTPAGPTRTAVSYVGRDIRFIKTALPRFYPIGQKGSRPIVWGAVFVLPMIALFGAIFYRRYQVRLEQDVAFARERRAGRAARKHLGRARELLRSGSRDAFYAEISRALRAFVANKLNIPEAGMLTEELRMRLSQRGVPPATIDALFTYLETCDRMRFAPAVADAEERKTLLHEAEGIVSALDRQIKR